MRACVFHKQSNQWLMWVSVYINPQNNLAQAESRRKTKACVCFLSSRFFPRLLPAHGECQQARISLGSRKNVTWRPLLWSAASPGVNQSIFGGRGDGSSRHTVLGVMSLFIIPQLVSVKGSGLQPFIAATLQLTSWLSAQGAAVHVELCVSPVCLANVSSSLFTREPFWFAAWFDYMQLLALVSLW